MKGVDDLKCRIRLRSKCVWNEVLEEEHCEGETCNMYLQLRSVGLFASKCPRT